MDREPRVLQQRIQVRAIRRRRDEPLERIRGQQREQQKADAEQPEYADDPGR